MRNLLDEILEKCSGRLSFSIINNFPFLFAFETSAKTFLSICQFKFRAHCDVTPTFLYRHDSHRLKTKKRFKRNFLIILKVLQHDSRTIRPWNRKPKTRINANTEQKKNGVIPLQRRINIIPDDRLHRQFAFYYAHITVWLEQKFRLRVPRDVSGAQRTSNRQTK